jgi:thiol-disulfide isomerase/thioredoxin
MHATIRIAVTTAILLALPGVSLAQHRIQWVATWPEASTMAQRTQRLVLLHFWNYNCPPCVLLERRVFNQPEVIRAVHSRYVPLKVNVADNAKMAEHFKIDKWPTDVIVTADGREVFRSVSQQDPHRFVATLHQVAAHESVGMPMHGYAATPAPPNQNTGYDATGFPVPGGEAAFAGPRNNAPRNNQQPAAPPTNPAVIENQFAGQWPGRLRNPQANSHRPWRASPRIRFCAKTPRRETLKLRTRRQPIIPTRPQLLSNRPLASNKNRRARTHQPWKAFVQ